jgi:hypothetical protein
MWGNEERDRRTDGYRFLVGGPRAPANAPSAPGTTPHAAKSRLRTPIPNLVSPGPGCLHDALRGGGRPSPIRVVPRRLCATKVLYHRQTRPQTRRGAAPPIGGAAPLAVGPSASRGIPGGTPLVRKGCVSGDCGEFRRCPTCCGCSIRRRLTLPLTQHISLTDDRLGRYTCPAYKGRSKVARKGGEPLPSIEPTQTRNESQGIEAQGATDELFGELIGALDDVVLAG